LYEYTQHGSNVIGHDTTPRASLARLIFRVFKGISTPEGRQRARAIYFEKVLKIQALATVLLIRGGDRIRPFEKRALGRLAALGESWRHSMWLALRGLRDWRQKGETMGAEYFLLQGLTWRYYIALRSRLTNRFSQTSNDHRRAIPSLTEKR